MKTREELDTLKEEIKNLNEKLSELTEEELVQVTGGGMPFLFFGRGGDITPKDRDISF